MKQKSLPGWTTKIDEISNGVFKVTLIDKYGRKAEIIDDATDETIERTLSDAFDIEKQVSKNWNKFIYDFCFSRLADNSITSNSYNDKDFGSWLIEVSDKRLLFLGKESWLVSQTKSNNEWFDNFIIKDEELNYKTVDLFLNQMQ